MHTCRLVSSQINGKRVNGTRTVWHMTTVASVGDSKSGGKKDACKGAQCNALCRSLFSI